MVLMRRREERLRQTAEALSCESHGSYETTEDLAKLAYKLDFEWQLDHLSSSATVPPSWAEISDTP